MAIPLPKPENFSIAMQRWREFEPPGSRVTGLAILTEVKDIYWSVNYSVVDDQFPAVDVAHMKRLRAILQHYCPANAILRRSSIITIPTMESKWQVTYSVREVLDNEQILRAFTRVDSIVDTITTDAATGITTQLVLKDTPSSSQGSSTTVHGSKTVKTITNDGSNQCKTAIQTRARSGPSQQSDRSNKHRSILEAWKSKTRDAVQCLKDVSLLRKTDGTFKSVRHKNFYHAMIRIASKKITTPITNEGESRKAKTPKVNFVKSHTLLPPTQKPKVDYKSVHYDYDKPKTIDDCRYQMKYFDRVDMPVLIAMDILYGKPNLNTYYTPQPGSSAREKYKIAINQHAKVTLARNGVPLFKSEVGEILFPEVLKRVGISLEELRLALIPVSELTQVLHRHTW